MAAVHGHGVDYSGLSPWARRRLFWPQSMGTDGTLLRKVSALPVDMIPPHQSQGRGIPRPSNEM